MITTYSLEKTYKEFLGFGIFIIKLGSILRFSLLYQINCESINESNKIFNKYK